MSAIESAYARLASDEERLMWTRAASVAQDERSGRVERQLALDVTVLLVWIGRLREFASEPLPVASEMTSRIEEPASALGREVQS